MIDNKISRRHFPRVRVQIPVFMKIKYMAGGEIKVYKQKAVISDLSVGGAFIIKHPAFSDAELIALAQKKAKVVLEFKLPPCNVPIMTQGRFRWSLSNDAIPGCSGIGVEFDSIATEDVLEIVRYTQSEASHLADKEKRVYPRIDTSINISLAKNIKSKVSNISASGLSFTTTPALNRNFAKGLEGKFLNIKLKLHNKQVSLRGKVVRLVKIKSGGVTGSKLGVEFHDTPSAQHRFLSGYVLVNQNKRQSYALSALA